MKYVDIHTHALTHDPEIIEIQSLDARIPIELSVPGSQHFCYGLHPWYISDVSEDIFFQGLKSSVQTPGFFALGEMGIDRVSSENLEKQIELFEKQIDIATKYRIERVIIHCVKAYSDILPILKKLPQTTAIILHDFNGNMEMVKQFSSMNTYFSFGAKLFNENTTAFKTFKEIDLSRVFLETDDQLDYGIYGIYKKASQIRNMDENELVARIYQNFCDIYPQQDV